MVLQFIVPLYGPFVKRRVVNYRTVTQRNVPPESLRKKGPLRLSIAWGGFVLRMCIHTARDFEFLSRRMFFSAKFRIS